MEEYGLRNPEEVPHCGPIDFDNIAYSFTELPTLVQVATGEIMYSLDEDTKALPEREAVQTISHRMIDNKQLGLVCPNPFNLGSHS